MDDFLPLSDYLSVQVSRVVDIPSVVSLLPVKAPDCKLPPAEPLPPSSNITISPVVNLLSPVKNSATVTPSKFSGKTVEELAAMSERDQVEKSLKQYLEIIWNLLGGVCFVQEHTRILQCWPGW